MGVQNLYNTIKAQTEDILNLGFDITKSQSQSVPNHEDADLTFEAGSSKKAKSIETCVLYADIRNSTGMSRNHPPEKMARLYTAFTKAVMNIAEYYGGYVRNIIGDRVMIVFPEQDCFRKSVECAFTINAAAHQIISKQFVGMEFKCGIGIDYGKKLVIKTGLPKRNDERQNYKNLIWISNSANIASKLTDLANKQITVQMVRITYNSLKLSLVGSALLGKSQSGIQNRIPVTKEISWEEFGKQSRMENGKTTYLSCEVTSLTKIEKKVTTPPILTSEIVWESYRKLNPSAEQFIKDWWKIQPLSIPNYNGKIHGSNIRYNVNESL